MRYCWLTGLYLLTALGLPAQVSTNYIEAHPSFRVVRGQLYNVDKSKAWSSQRGVIRYLSNSVAIVASVIPREVPLARQPLPKANWAGRMGAFSGPMKKTTNAPPPPPKPRIVYEDGPTIAVTNLPANELIVDRTIDCRLLQVGRYDFNGKPIALYDYGQPHRVPAGWKPEKP